MKEQGKEAGVGAMAGVVAAAAKESGARATKESGASLRCAVLGQTSTETAAKESTARASLPRAVLDPRGSPGLSQLLRYARCVDRSGPARDEPLG